MKLATTIEEQIQKLEKRGMVIEDKQKAREILLDIGYYRLGFYWFPLEKNYPSKCNREHELIEGASFKWATDLYYTDTKIRNVLMPFLSRIEVNLRTFIIYTVSNKYRFTPTWFADSKVMTSAFISSFPDTYLKLKNNEAIKMHHKKYPNDIYAPAWKTIEYMTFGDLLVLLKNIKDKNLQLEIANHYGLRNLNVFYSYLETIRIMRNLCAHGHNIFDLKLQKSIKAGPLHDKLTDSTHHNLCGVILVIDYFLHFISDNRCKEMKNEIVAELKKESTAELWKPILDCCIDKM